MSSRDWAMIQSYWWVLITANHQPGGFCHQNWYWLMANYSLKAKRALSVKDLNMTHVPTCLVLWRWTTTWTENKSCSNLYNGLTTDPMILNHENVVQIQVNLLHLPSVCQHPINGCRFQKLNQSSISSNRCRYLPICNNFEHDFPCFSMCNLSWHT